MRSRAIFLLIIFIVIILHFLKNMGFSYYPESSAKVLSVIVEMEGAGAEEMEELLCNPLEEEIMMIPGISSFYSRSGWEKTEITLFLDDTRDLNSCYLDLRALIERKSHLFPPRAAKALIHKSSSLKNPEFIFVPELLNSEKDNDSTPSWTEEKIRSKLKGISGISRIHVSSSAGQDINIKFEEDSFYAIQMDTIDLASLIHEHNSIAALSLKDSSQLVFDQRLKSISDFMSLPLGSALRLDEKAKINIGFSDSKSLSRLNGQRQSLVWIYKNGDANTIELCRNLREASKSIPGSLILYDKGEVIEKAIKELFKILGLSICSVIFMTLVILKKTWSVFPVCLNVPFSICGTLALFNAFSWEINILVLASLALCSGMIIDSGIIVLEQGYEQSKRALWASLFSTLIVLFPFIFASAALKALCLPLIKTICVCLTISLCFIFLTMKHLKPHIKQDNYLMSLPGICKSPQSFQKYRLSFIIIILVLCVFSLFLVKNLNYSQDFTLNKDNIRFSIEFPAGSRKEFIEQKLKQLEKALGQMSGTEYYSSEYKDEKASFRIKLSNHQKKEELEQLIIKAMDDLPGFLYFEDREVEDSYRIRILAHNRNLLFEETKKLSYRLQDLFKSQSLTLHYKKQPPLVCIQTNNNLSAKTAINPLITARALSLYLSPPVLGKWIPGDGSIYDIRIINNKSNTVDRNSIGKIKISGNGNYTVEEIALLTDKEDYGPIDHYNSQRSAAFSFSTEGYKSARMHKVINQTLKTYNLPEGVRVIHGEEYKDRLKNMRELLKLLSASLVLLLILLIFLFESAFLPLCLMVQIILCHLFTLGFLSVMNVNLSVPVFFALILNTGLTINNGLIVFSRFRKKRPTAKEALESMMQCKATILTATLTTLTGFIPFLIAGEASSEILKALSLTLGCSLIFSIPLLLGSLFCFKDSTFPPAIAM